MVALGRRTWLLVGLPALVAVACGGDKDDPNTGLTGGASGHAGKAGSGGTAGTTVIPTTGGTSTGSGGNGGSGAAVQVGGTGTGATGGTSGTGPDVGGSAGADMCAHSEYEQKTTSALDIYFVFDRTGSMGDDCAYTHGMMAPVMSKACYATYAFSDYLIDGVTAGVDTRLAFQFMSLAQDDCDGGPYSTPLVPLTPLPVPADHVIIQDISNETFEGGLGTHIEGALRGIAAYTAAHQEPGREIIGVLMTDGDPQGCDEDIGNLSDIVSAHFDATGLRTFIIGMEGANDGHLEELGIAGGADPHDMYCGSVNEPCHYWNVGNGSQNAIKDALTAIVQQAAPIPCEFPTAGLKPPAGQALDFGKVNVTLTDSKQTETTIGQVADEAACPDDVPAWYYDDPKAPTKILLCDKACAAVTDAENGSKVNIVVGCEETVVVPPIR